MANIKPKRPNGGSYNTKYAHRARYLKSWLQMWEYTIFKKLPFQESEMFCFFIKKKNSDKVSTNEKKYL